MLNTTLSRLRCPICQSALKLASTSPNPCGVTEIRSGLLACPACEKNYPILAGVAILMEDVREYLLAHVKGISRATDESEIPEEYREEFIDARNEIEIEHIEEDLESERVNALYLMNHYLHAESDATWWKPLTGEGSAAIDQVIRAYWDQGPFPRIQSWVEKLARERGAGDVIELGCGVGGLFSRLSMSVKSYLGVDSSFASVALARHLALGLPYHGSLRVPGDLLQGPVSRPVNFPVVATHDGRADFVVGDISQPPLPSAQWDVAIALNTIDMFDDPAKLPVLQASVLRPNGVAIQSCPYIWHEEVAKELCARLPSGIQDSARAAEWLYETAGFTLLERVDHLPWLFFKHLRQLEIYSVHLFASERKA